MLKTKLLAISLVISIMIMGTGYAAWKSNADIKTNASTGSFAIDLEKDETGTFIYKSDHEEGEQYLDKKYAKVTYGDILDPSINNGSASIKFENLYPGSTAISDIKVTNNSTMPIKYDKITYSISGTTLNSLLSSNMIQIYVMINNIEYQLGVNSDNVDIKNSSNNSINGDIIKLNDNHDIDFPSGDNISHIKVKLVVSSLFSDTLQDGLQIQLSPSFKQYNS